MTTRGSGPSSLPERGLRATAGVLAAALAFTVTACGSGSSAVSSGHTKLVVLAASSLTDTFTTLAAAFEKDHAGVQVVTSFGSSTTLAEQVVNGAPADVIATADDTSMHIVADKHLLSSDPVPFASNTMIIATPPHNPGRVSSLRDLAGVDFVMCDPSAPCGAAAQSVLDKARVQAKPRSLEADARSVLSKVTLKEADAGLVYVTDAKAAGDSIDTVAIPPADNTVNAYYIAPVKSSNASATAKQWLSLVTSQAGQRVLRSAGFGPP
jgi:molybdate transport system substrate-binding protein